MGDYSTYVRFRCGCGRTVVTDPGTPADNERHCSRCRRRSRLASGATLTR